MSLGLDLTRAWESPGTTPETRKKIIRIGGPSGLRRLDTFEPSSARSSASTNASIARTGLSSSI
jgi:hypothetical protein